MPRVVWAEESKTSLGFEIRPSYDDVLTRSQCVTDEQSSCTCCAHLLTHKGATQHRNKNIWYLVSSYVSMKQNV